MFLSVLQPLKILCETARVPCSSEIMIVSDQPPGLATQGVDEEAHVVFRRTFISIF